MIDWFIENYIGINKTRRASEKTILILEPGVDGT